MKSFTGYELGEAMRVLGYTPKTFAFSMDVALPTVYRWLWCRGTKVPIRNRGLFRATENIVLIAMQKQSFRRDVKSIPVKAWKR